ncbi:MAG: ATP-binding protein [Cyanobacteria bacterium P01_F01_bin.53]
MDTTVNKAFPTVLIVDDSASDRAVFRRYLTKNGDLSYQLLEVESAEEGLSLLEHTAVDLILLDYGLPGLDGLAFLQRLKECTGLHIPVLMLTGQGDESVAAQSIKAGAQDYIVKQRQMGDVLRLAVRNALREAALQRQVSRYQGQQSLIQDIVLRIRQSLDSQAVLTRAADEVRSFLGCDRVIFYRFLPTHSGVVEVESVGKAWPAIQGEVFENACFESACFEEGWVETYRSGRTTTVENIHASDLSPGHVELLARFEVQSNLVVPIMIAGPPIAKDASCGQDDKTLWGLLIAHQCDRHRQWQKNEIQLLQQLSDQLAIALRQSALYQELQLANQKLEAKVEARTAQLQQVNASLLQVNQALIASNQDLEQFAYIASHDLREPLRKIKSFAELLAKRYQGELDETADRYINYITGGAVRMQALINDLLAYSRLGKHELARVETDLDQVLAQSLETLSSQIAQHQAVVHAKPLPTLPVDPLRIEQLFRNLIGNALKYKGDQLPKILIKAEYRAPEKSYIESDSSKVDFSGDHAPEWVFFVQDNGIGIAPEFCDRIFAIFQRLHSKSEYSGTGIGLAICQKIVERHGGKIGVESTVGRGSTFWFTLPAQ